MPKRYYPNLVEVERVLEVVGAHMQIEGFRLIPDLQRSQGSYLWDASRNRPVLDMFGFFATLPLGHNHPALTQDEAFLKNLQLAAITNPSNSDFYTQQMATFLDVFYRVAMRPQFAYVFFIAGGAPAVENALKTAMDWKVQKNFQEGSTRELGHHVLYFNEAFHGRTGYALSITWTSPEKVRYFARFPWTRIPNPKITFPLEEHLQEVQKAEEQAIEAIHQAFRKHGKDICAIIIEPIQSEGGENHFRKEFLQALRQIADQYDVLLIFDEVQTGVGATGTFWCYEQLDVIPDIVVFGKKMQVCGIMVSPRIDEVPQNVFHVKSRINSTWGGNLVDMVRATQILRVIEEDNLIENARERGQELLNGLHALAQRFPISNVRGRGLHCAFDLPSQELRERLLEVALDQCDLLLLGCGQRSIRFRPHLAVTSQDIQEALNRLEDALAILFRQTQQPQQQ